MPEIKWVSYHNGFEPVRMLRVSIFEQEQGFQEEFDELDPIAAHMLLLEDGQPIGCGRLARIDDARFKPGRIAVLPHYRSGGYGRVIMQALEARAQRLGGTLCRLGAQVSAMGFYEKLDYHPAGDRYYEEHVEHIPMEKRLSPSPYTVKWVQPGGDITHAVALLKEVFGGEFGYTNDPDEADPLCHTLLIYQHQLPVACGRIDSRQAPFKLGKIAVKQQLRGTGIGRVVMDNLEFQSLTMGAVGVSLNAQQVAADFYATIGYTQQGDEFDIQGHAHIPMGKIL